MADFLFYFLSIVAVAAGAGVVLSKSPMMSVIALLATFFCLAVVYLLAGFQFMAVAQILVYAGAILVLFLFVIMLLNLGDTDVQFYVQRRLLTGKARLALGIAAALGMVGAVAARRSPLGEHDARLHEEGIDGMTELAAALFGRYSLPFEVASLLLLATMVAVIALAKRERSGKSIEPAEAPALGLATSTAPATPRAPAPGSPALPSPADSKEEVTP